MRRLTLTLLLTLTTLLCATISNGQTATPKPVAAWVQLQPPAQVKETLKSQFGDEYVVIINGKEYRAITPDHARAIIADKQKAALTETELALRTKEVGQLKDAIGAAQSIARIADLQAQLADEKATKAQLIITHQQELLAQAERLIGRRGWFDKLLENTYVSIGTKLLVPALNLYFAQRAKH